MAVLLQVGIAYPNELSSHIGHVACTLGGVNYESRGGRGCLRGSSARGATNSLFRHRFFVEVTSAQAQAAMVREGSPQAGHVRWIQARLDYAAHRMTLAVDGGFGPLTRDEVMAFQRRHGLAVDGVVGPRTWAALNAVR